jgi:hypothetical protein
MVRHLVAGWAAPAYPEPIIYHVIDPGCGLVRHSKMGPPRSGMGLGRVKTRALRRRRAGGVREDASRRALRGKCALNERKEGYK